MGEIDLAGILVFEFLEAAPRTAVAQAFPFGAGHLLQRLGFPKESLLTRGRFGSCGHESLRFRAGNGLEPPSWGCCGPVASRVPRQPLKGRAALALLFKIVSQTIGLWPLLG